MLYLIFFELFPDQIYIFLRLKAGFFKYINLIQKLLFLTLSLLFLINERIQNEFRCDIKQLKVILILFEI